MMKISSTALLLALMMAGCSSKEVAPVMADEAAGMGMVHVENVTSHQLHSAIMRAGKAQGWKMTAFKSNEVIAEKFGEYAVTASIKFDKHGYEVDSDNHNDAVEDLKSAIKEQLKVQ